MRTLLNRLTLALGVALAIFSVAGGLPAQAAGPSSGAAVPPAVLAAAGVVANSPAEARALSLPATPERVRQVRAYLAAHPIRGRVEPLPRQAPATAPTPTHAASAWFNWWGVRVYLTGSDLHNLFFALTIYGFTAVAGAICAPGAFMAVVCGAIGIVAGYIVAQAVWNTWGYRGGCGLYIDIQWSLYWSSWGC